MPIATYFNDCYAILGVLPFTVEQFYGVSREYNTTVWSAQIFLLVLAVVAVALVVFPRRWSGLGVSSILAFLWAWLGLVYHLSFFTVISAPAYGFAAVSVMGSLIFLWQGVVRRRLEFRLTTNARTAVGVLLIVFALVVYPAWSIDAGHYYPNLVTFGLPCPTTIFTIGLFAFTVRPYPRSPLVVPVLWSLIGGQAAFLFGVPQDLGLLVAGVVGIVLIARSKVKKIANSEMNRDYIAVQNARFKLKNLMNLNLMLHSIAFIRFVHTAIFVFFNVIMAVLLYEVVADKISILTWIIVGLFAIEVIVLIANNWTCPLTIYAENLESYRGQTTDIFFLPKWFGDRMFLFYDGLLVVALLLLLIRLLT